jgi:hypothetical protein
MVRSMTQVIVPSIGNDWRCGNVWGSERAERIEKLVP